MLGLFPALAQAHLPIVDPGPTLLHDVQFHTEIEKVPLKTDPLIEHDVKFSRLERRSDLVLDHLGSHTVANRLAGGIFDGRDAPYVQTDGTVEFQGITARRGLRVAEHHTDLYADLIDEDQTGFALADHARHFSQGLAHEAGLQTHMALSHLPLQFRRRHQGRHRVDHNDVHRIGLY